MDDPLIEAIWALLGPAAATQALMSGKYNTPEWVEGTKAQLYDLLYPEVQSDPVIEPEAPKDIEPVVDPTPPPQMVTDSPNMRVFAKGGSALLGTGGSIRIFPIKNFGYLDPHEVPSDSPEAALDMTQDLNYREGDELISRQLYTGVQRGAKTEEPYVPFHHHVNPEVDPSAFDGDGDTTFHGYKSGSVTIRSASDTLRYEEEYGGVRDLDLVAAIEGQLQEQENLEGYDPDNPTPENERTTFDRSNGGVAMLRTKNKAT